MSFENNGWEAKAVLHVCCEKLRLFNKPVTFMKISQRYCKMLMIYIAKYKILSEEGQHMIREGDGDRR